MYVLLDCADLALESFRSDYVDYLPFYQPLLTSFPVDQYLIVILNLLIKYSHQALVDNLNTSTVGLETEMNRLGVDEATVESLGQEKRDLQTQIRDLSDNAENIYHRYPDLQFRYTRPSANFNDASVKGLVAKVGRCCS